MKKTILYVLVITILLTLVSGCTGKTSSKDTGDIFIASAGPMTGDSAQFGDIKVKAIQLAIDKANEEGGINGRMIKQLVGDDTGNPKEAPSVAQKFANDNSIVAVIGHWNSSCTLAARDIYQQAKIPVITDSVNKAVTDGTTPLVYRISLTDTAQATQLARYAYEYLGKRKAAIIFTSNDFGVGITRDFTDIFTKMGGEVVASEAFFEGQGQSKDYSTQLTKIKEQNPDLLLVAGYYVETALIAQQSQALGLNVQMLGTDGITSEELVKLGGEAVEGIVFAGFFHPDIEFEGTKQFVEEFREKYGKDPDTYAALAYDSARLIIEGMKKNGATREGIDEYLKTVKDFPGIAGPISFENNDVTRLVILLTVKDGKIVPAEKQFN